MYEIYSTKAFVLKSLLKKDSDQEVFLFTKDFGFIRAVVSGSKKDISKHRGLIEDFSFINVFLIITKTGYRITGGEFLENIFFNKIENKNEKIETLKNIYLLIEKIFLKGELDNKIFNFLENFYFKLISFNGNLKKEEVYFIIKILSQMGYVDENELIRDSKKEKDEIVFLTNFINERLGEIDFNN